ncbi:hypothetical protein RvY_02616 [Ramazzottius varieornatus]|uniref:BTB domain-containing protein n=1 Tax=Ramazzottius varieornatus TaxID=947166 RepID=A0A1D1UKC0_RAMVA|nr:hypothetical protein RvY_02616 [Ramazzottius varieornatus]
MSEAEVTNSVLVNNSTVKPQGKAQLLLNLLRRKSTLPPIGRLPPSQEASHSIDRKVCSQVLHSVAEEQSIDKSLTVPSFHKSSHQSKLRPPAPLPPIKVETPKETVTAEKEINSTYRSNHSEPFSHKVFSLLERTGEEVKNESETPTKSDRRRSSLVAPPRNNAISDCSDYRKNKSPPKPDTPKSIPQKPSRKSLRPFHDDDSLLRDVKNPFEFVPKGRKHHTGQKTQPSFKSQSLHSDTSNCAATVLPERSAEWFTQARNQWVKKARAIESMQWTIGNKEAHEKRVERFFVTTQAENRFCDVVIQTTDNHTIHAHSLVLAAHSKAFQKRLLAMNPGTGVPTTYRLNLTDKVSGAMLAKAVNWMYKGYTRIPAHQLEELSRVARYFQIVLLAVECVKRRREMETEAGDHKLVPEEADASSVSQAPSSLHNAPPVGLHNFPERPARRRDQLPIQQPAENFPEFVRGSPRLNTGQLRDGPSRLTISSSTQWSDPPSARSTGALSPKELPEPSISKLPSGVSSEFGYIFKEESFPGKFLNKTKLEARSDLMSKEVRDVRDAAMTSAAPPVEAAEEPSIANMTVKQMHELLSDDNLDVQVNFTSLGESRMHACHCVVLVVVGAGGSGRGDGMDRCSAFPKRNLYAPPFVLCSFLPPV